MNGAKETICPPMFMRDDENVANFSALVVLMGLICDRKLNADCCGSWQRNLGDVDGFQLSEL